MKLQETYEDYSFKNMLEVEKSMQPIADAFYKSKLKALQIKRYDYNDPRQRSWQQHDIDCSVQLYAPGLDVFWLNYSEKFRTYESGDMCLELWSDFEKNKPGWALKHEGFNPDAFLYVTPKYIFEVWRNWMFDRMIDRVTAELTQDKARELFKDYKDVDNVSIPITICGHQATLIKSTTKWSDRKYFGICVAIPWRTLWIDHLLQISMYSRKGYDKLNINEVYK